MGTRLSIRELVTATFCMVLAAATILSFSNASPINHLSRRQPNDNYQAPDSQPFVYGTLQASGQEEEAVQGQDLSVKGQEQAEPGQAAPLAEQNAPLAAGVDPSEANLPLCETPEPDLPIQTPALGQPPQVADQNPPAPVLGQPQVPTQTQILPSTLPQTPPATLPQTLPPKQTPTLPPTQTQNLQPTDTQTLQPTQTQTPLPTQSQSPPPTQAQTPPAGQTGSVTLEQLSTQLNEMSRVLKSMQTIGQIGQLMAFITSLNRLQPLLAPGMLPGVIPKTGLPQQSSPNQSTSLNPYQKLTSINPTSINPTSLEPNPPPVRRRRLESYSATSLDV